MCMKVGIWGWSYGGYLTAKVVERDSSDVVGSSSHVFNAAVAVAPVVDWRFYDSIYTERYMNQPFENEQGYLNASVHDLRNFKHARFLAIHGTGDDNVHVQNSLHLLSQLTSGPLVGGESGGVVGSLKDLPDAMANYRVHLITDDDHSMWRTPNAHQIVHRMMMKWFVDAWNLVDETMLNFETQRSGHE